MFCTKRCIVAAAVLFSLVASGALAAPQTSMATVRGAVTDEQGAGVPGVTVTATSPAQIGSLTAVTNETGIYRFPAVPPGAYPPPRARRGSADNLQPRRRVSVQARSF